MRIEVDINGNITEYEDAPIIEISKDEFEKNRILLIKVKAKEVIERKYPSYKQLNILMSGVDADISNMNEYITNIRNISNEAEANGTALEDIIWN